nr:MAG TPA: hypothetical protein [Microviridae sp.]
MPISNKRVGIFRENFHKKVIINKLQLFRTKLRFF